MTDTQQYPAWTYPAQPPAPPVSAGPKLGWHRRHWVHLVAVGVVALGLGAASASGSSSDLNKKLAAADQRADSATARATEAEGQISSANTKVSAAEQAQKTAETTAATAVVKAEATLKAKFANQAGQLAARAAALTSQAAALTAREQKVSGMEADAQANQIAGDGLYRVGSDIKPGIYKAGPADSGNCYYARLSSLNSSDIIDNGNTSGSVVIIVKSSDAALMVSGCNTFQKVG